MIDDVLTMTEHVGMGCEGATGSAFRRNPVGCVSQKKTDT